ncbi:pre-rRNA processing [Malassezia caprae]|uniref:Pre-rRNA processing n=1 Tax=Malassezia caprae TaxID=1381934 RepID=A0AAF0IWR8_9BASI|nr:pre-rRNA processing [Malassezia caprae]
MPLASPAVVPAKPPSSEPAAIEEYVSHVLGEADAGIELDDAFVRDEHAQMVWARHTVDRALSPLRARMAPLDGDGQPSGTINYLLEALRLRISTSPSPRLLCVYAMIRALGERDMNVYRWLLYAQGVCVLPGWIHRLVHNVWAGYYASQASATMASDATTRFKPALPLPGAAARVEGVCSEALSERMVLLSLETHALELLHYTLCVVRLRPSDLRALSVHFVDHLFDTMELAQQDHEEEYCMRLMRMILSLHEQCLVQDPSNGLHATIRHRLHTSKTFGEKLVFRLNRTSSATLPGCLFHFLTLKLLAEVFAQRETASYFYTNDLRVLVDIFLRELGSLAEAHELLRQAYLCVFRALLTQTQLCSDPYKRADVQLLLTHMVGGAQWHDVSPVTLALANDCLESEWFVGLQDGKTLVAPIQGGEVHAAQLTKEHAENQVHFHARPTLQTIQHTLVLRHIQSAAAAVACTRGTYVDMDATVMWPSHAAATESDVAPSEVDVLALERWTSAPPPTQVPTRRRVPPPRPRKPARMVPVHHPVMTQSLPDLTSIPPEAHETGSEPTHESPAHLSWRHLLRLRSKGRDAKEGRTIVGIGALTQPNADPPPPEHARPVRRRAPPPPPR